jgi:hypothetical protein
LLNPMAHKGPNRNDQANWIKRDVVIAERYLAGASQWAIAGELGVSPATICLRLKKIRKMWLDSSLRDFDEKKAQELAKIDHLERTAYEAWGRSCKNAEIEVWKVQRAVKAVEKECNGKANHRYGVAAGLGKRAEVGKLVPAEKTIKGQSGDPRFLELIRSCIEMRCKIFGLYKDITIDNRQVTVNLNDALAKEAVERLKVIDVGAVESNGQSGS